MSRTRKITNLLLEMMEDGALDPRTVADACLSYMSESDVADMAHTNDLLPELEEDEAA